MDSSWSRNPPSRRHNFAQGTIRGRLSGTGSSGNPQQNWVLSAAPTGERGTVHVAEQVSVARPPALIIEAFERGSSNWAEPFVLPAWSAGELAIAPRRPANESAVQKHRFRLGRPVKRTPTSAIISVRRTVSPSTPLFVWLVDELVVQPFGDRAIMGLSAVVTARDGTEVWGTEQSPVELIVRTLLGHLRTGIAGEHAKG